MSNARFSILQAVAVSDRRVSDAQFRTLAALGMYADKLGWCYPSLKTLAADLKKSPQAVGRDTIALRKLGYLEVKNRYDSKTKSRHSNLYRLRYDVSDFNVDDTPLSTPEVDTLSTPEVDVNDPYNDPINHVFLSAARQEPDKIAEWLKMGQFAGAKRETRIDAILSYLGERFHVNTEVKKWKDFAKFVETRQTHHGEQVDIFISKTSSIALPFYVEQSAQRFALAAGGLPRNLRRLITYGKKT